MSQAQLITHKGKRIVYVDLAGCRGPDVPATTDQAKRLIASQPKESALILTDVTNMQLTSETSNIMKEFSEHNTPYTKASAVVGIEGLRKIIYSAVQHLSGRSIPTFETLDQAKDWLVQQ